jgi:long-chain acyl-CoA synthetase
MFWNADHLQSSTCGLYDVVERQFLSYEQISDLADKVEQSLRFHEKALVVLLCDNSAPSIIAYIGALRAGHAVMLSNKTVNPALIHRLVETYQPEFVLTAGAVGDLPPQFIKKEPGAPGLTLWQSTSAFKSPIYKDTAVLLSTSGTTGSPKLIRLTYRNIQANAQSIVEYLGLTETESAITSLPMSYSYGLSVINSHLFARANLVCTNASLVAPDFWAAFRERACTSLAGVPISYGMLEKLRFQTMTLPSLRTLTQAGGRLAQDKVEMFCEIAKKKGLRLFVMYGQTEATARIAYVPWEQLPNKLGSVGIAIPRGTLRLENDDIEIEDAGQAGELIYEGPNVMLGYAEDRSGLARGDEMNGRLRTGDIGYRDRDGFYFITGRLKRFIKIAGLRLNLDEVEKMLETALKCQVACGGADETLQIVVESAAATDLAEAKKRVSELYKLHHSTFQIHQTSALPVNSSGKKDYSAIMHGLK